MPELYFGTNSLKLNIEIVLIGRFAGMLQMYQWIIYFEKEQTKQTTGAKRLRFDCYRID